jgi:hypothetical protein
VWFICIQVITIKVECVRDKDDMQTIVDLIREVFIEDRRKREEETGGNSLAMDEIEEEKDGVEVCVCRSVCCSVCCSDYCGQESGGNSLD